VSNMAMRNLVRSRNLPIAYSLLEPIT